MTTWRCLLVLAAVSVTLDRSERDTVQFDFISDNGYSCKNSTLVPRVGLLTVRGPLSALLQQEAPPMCNIRQ